MEGSGKSMALGFGYAPVTPGQVPEDLFSLPQGLASVAVMICCIYSEPMICAYVKLISSFQSLFIGSDLLFNSDFRISSDMDSKQQP